MSRLSKKSIGWQNDVHGKQNYGFFTKSQNVRFLRNLFEQNISAYIPIIIDYSLLFKMYTRIRFNIK